MPVVVLATIIFVGLGCYDGWLKGPQKVIRDYCYAILGGLVFEPFVNLCYFSLIYFLCHFLALLCVLDPTKKSNLIESNKKKYSNRHK